MSGRKEGGRRQVCLDKSVRGQTEFILPNLPSPLSTSHVHRAFRFLEGTVTFLPRPEAPSKAKDSAASLASLPPGAQLPWTPWASVKYQVPPRAAMEGARSGLNRRLLPLWWLALPCILGAQTWVRLRSYASRQAQASQWGHSFPSQRPSLGKHLRRVSGTTHLCSKVPHLCQWHLWTLDSSHRWRSESRSCAKAVGHRRAGQWDI